MSLPLAVFKGALLGGAVGAGIELKSKGSFEAGTTFKVAVVGFTALALVSHIFGFGTVLGTVLGFVAFIIDNDSSESDLLKRAAGAALLGGTAGYLLGAVLGTIAIVGTVVVANVMNQNN